MKRATQRPVLSKGLSVLVLAAVLAAPARGEDIRRAESWPPGTPIAPVAERVAPAPPALVRYLQEDNRKHGFRQVPRAADPGPDLAADLRTAIATMPQAVHALVTDKLIGVYTVRELGSTAWAEHVAGADGTWQRGIVVLDVQAVDKRANTWISWRESTAFRPMPGFALRARIAEPGEDGRVAAIRYILLHEFAHVASIGAGFLPDWDVEAVPAERTCDYAFVCLSWTRYGDGYRSRHDDGFAERSRIAYYAPAERRLDAARARALYDWLAGTDFVSAYAATTPHEDFAESFANFVHVRMMGQPYRVDIIVDGKEVAGAGPCWEAPRCAAKRRFFETLLNVGTNERTN